MAQVEDENIDQLDAFFNAADARRTDDMQAAAESISKEAGPAEEDAAAAVAAPDPEVKKKKRKRVSETPLTGIEGDVVIPEEDAREMTSGDLDGKFIAIDPEAIPGVKGTDPFVLVPANIHTYVPWWGWVTIALGLLVFVTAVILMPGVSLNRLASRLGDANEASVQKAMRQLVVKGDERTVRKLFAMASSPQEGLKTRLRAVDTMSLIERVPEVDRALLRLELSSGTHDQVREAAIAARKQREAYKARGANR